MSVTTPIERPPQLREKVYDQLKSLIVTNQLKPGTSLVEEQLAAELGISRTPLREVLAALEREGLVKKNPNRGMVVPEISSDDIENIYELRSLLECYAAARATMQIPHDDLVKIKGQFDGAEKEIERKSYESYYRSHRELHHLILLHCGNPQLSQILDFVDFHIQRIRAFAGQSPDRHVKEAFKEQSRLLKALLDQNPKSAESAMADHLRNAKLRIEEQLAETALSENESTEHARSNYNTSSMRKQS